VAWIAEQQFEQNQFEDVAYFEPFYLKEFIAGKPSKKVI
jgi:tRNA threonylcarbamoyladenosine biosynthesis protein TsaB